MPEKQEVDWHNLEGKGWLYQNEAKTSEKHPDFKGKMAGISYKELEKAVDEEGNISINLSGWKEKDKNDVDRVGMKASIAIPKGATATASAFE